MIIRLIMCFFTALALCMRFELPEELNEFAGGSRMLNIFYNFQLSLTGTMVAATVVFVALLLLERYLHKKGARRGVLLYAICFVIAIVWAVGESFRRVDSLALLHAGAGQAVKTIVYIAGITWLLAQAAALLSVFLESGWDWKYKENRWSRLYHKHPFGMAFSGLLLCWLPNLLLSCPAAMCVDVWNQMLQFFGMQKFTTHHPPVHTVLVGLSEKLGLSLGSGNAGLFIYIIFQTILFALILAYMLDTMRKMETPVWLRGLTFVIAVVSPYYTQYIGMIVKDNIYSYFIVLFVIELVYMLILKQKYWLEKKHLLLLGVSVIGSILFRNNGKYVIYPMILLILIMLFIQNGKKEGARIILTAFAVLIISAGAASGVQNGLVRYYQIGDGSIKEALSLPFQQTARYVKEHGDEVTGKEKKAIQGVLAYNKLAERYDPRISDPVKATYKKKATMEDLKEYLIVWFQQGLKHPVTYVEATMNQNYYLLYPLMENNTLYDATEPDKSAAKELAEDLGIHEIPIIQKLDQWRTGFNKVLFSFPVFGLLASMAFFNLILIYLCYAAIRKRVPEMALILMPLLLSDAIIVLAPVIKGHPRYAFPIVYSLPLVFASFLYFERKVIKKKQSLKMRKN